MHSTLSEQVSELLAEAAARFMVPRFRRLAQTDAAEKSPGEWVTIVDTEVEAFLAAGLVRLAPAAVVGEEACAAQPELLKTLHHGDVWLIDPLDGTSNFMAGRTEFAILVALLRQGNCVAGWMYRPLEGLCYVAQQGGGAWCNGTRLAVPVHARVRQGIVKTRFLPAATAQRIAHQAARDSVALQAGANCTALDYPDIIAGRSDFALYGRTLPWDHAAGALLLQEAGGCVARADGTPYVPSDGRAGLVAAAHRCGSDWIHAAAGG